jgi:hypothetical protein
VRREEPFMEPDIRYLALLLLALPNPYDIPSDGRGNLARQVVSTRFSLKEVSERFVDVINS